MPFISFKRFVHRSQVVNRYYNFSPLLFFCSGGFMPSFFKNSCCFCLNQFVSLTPSIVNLSLSGSEVDGLISATELSILNRRLCSGEYNSPINRTGFISKSYLINSLPNPKCLSKFSIRNNSLMCGK